jgi:hypothetical protein
MRDRRLRLGKGEHVNCATRVGHAGPYFPATQLYMSFYSTAEHLQLCHQQQLADMQAVAAGGGASRSRDNKPSIPATSTPNTSGLFAQGHHRLCAASSWTLRHSNWIQRKAEGEEWRGAPTTKAPTSALTMHAMLVKVAMKPTVTWLTPPSHVGQWAAKEQFKAGTANERILTQNDGKYPEARESPHRCNAASCAWCS